MDIATVSSSSLVCPGVADAFEQRTSPVSCLCLCLLFNAPDPIARTVRLRSQPAIISPRRIRLRNTARVCRLPVSWHTRSCSLVTTFAVYISRFNAVTAAITFAIFRRRRCSSARHRVTRLTRPAISACHIHHNLLPLFAKLVSVTDAWFERSHFARRRRATTRISRHLDNNACCAACCQFCCHHSLPFATSTLMTYHPFICRAMPRISSHSPPYDVARL